MDPSLLRYIYDNVYDGLIKEIDATTNGVLLFDDVPNLKMTTDICSRISRCTPFNSARDEVFLAQFNKALSIANGDFIDVVFYHGRLFSQTQQVPSTVTDRSDQQSK